MPALTNMWITITTLTGPLPSEWGTPPAFPRLQYLLINDTDISGGPFFFRLLKLQQQTIWVSWLQLGCLLQSFHV